MHREIYRVMLQMLNGSFNEPQKATHLRGPTIPADEDEYHKFDFEESWDRPPFTAMSMVIKIGSRGYPLKGKKGETLYENEVRTEG